MNGNLPPGVSARDRHFYPDEPLDANFVCTDDDCAVISWKESDLYRDPDGTLLRRWDGVPAVCPACDQPGDEA